MLTSSPTPSALVLSYLVGQRVEIQAAAKRAEAILERMQELYEAGNVDIKPDTISFSTVISAWAKSGDPAAAKRAEAILERMQELYEAGNVDVKPNTICLVLSFLRGQRVEIRLQQSERKQYLSACKNFTKREMLT